MRNYIIYYTPINNPQNEKMAKVKAESTQKAINLFYQEYSPRLYEVTGYEVVTAPCNW